MQAQHDGRYVFRLQIEFAHVPRFDGQAGNRGTAHPIEVNRLDPIKTNMNGTIHRRASGLEDARYGERFVGMLRPRQSAGAMR